MRAGGVGHPGGAACYRRVTTTSNSWQRRDDGGVPGDYLDNEYFPDDRGEGHRQGINSMSPDSAVIRVGVN